MNTVVRNVLNLFKYKFKSKYSRNKRLNNGLYDRMFTFKISISALPVRQQRESD